MAIHVCSEITLISPRISFSHDLDLNEAAPIERRLDSSLLDSTSDFCFTGTTFAQQLSSADELFSNGKILPIQINKPPIPVRQNRGSVPNSSLPPPSEKKMLKEFLSTSSDEEDGNPPPAAKPFWQFSRSSSLNYDSSRGKSLIRSLDFLSRSNSTGSVPNPKQSVQSQRPCRQKQAPVSTRKPSSSSNHTHYPYRPPMNKCGSQGGGVRINLPPPYISRASVNLFGFGSIFCRVNSRSKRRKDIF